MTRRRPVASAVACVALAVLGATLAAVRSAAAETSEITAYFPSAISVYPSGSVKVLGLSAGKVSRVQPQGGTVMVKIRMDGDVPLPADVRATIVPSSLIGERYIQLFPAWTDGAPKAPAKLVIPLERTSVPVEPDEALAALKRLLDGLDPDATGRLVTNLAADLDGQGQHLSSALSGLSRLTRTLADKDEQIAGIIDNVDRLTTTLRTRESQLASVIDSFARAASLLAQERQQLQHLLKGLGEVSVDALELVRANRVDLKDDLDTVSRLLVSVSANLDSVKTLLETAPVLAAGRDLDGRTEGLLAAYDPTYHLIDLRPALSPLAGNALGRLVGILGLPATTICLPVDVTCASSGAAARVTAAPAPASGSGPAPAAPPRPAPSSPGPATATSATSAPPASGTRAAPPPRTPLDGILDLLDGGKVKGQSASAAVPFSASPSAGGAGAWFRRAARSAVEALA